MKHVKSSRGLQPGGRERGPSDMGGGPTIGSEDVTSCPFANYQEGILVTTMAGGLTIPGKRGGGQKLVE